jgi:hypothetical protein
MANSMVTSGFESRFSLLSHLYLYPWKLVFSANKSVTQRKIQEGWFGTDHPSWPTFITGSLFDDYSAEFHNFRWEAYGYDLYGLTVPVLRRRSSEYSLRRERYFHCHPQSSVFIPSRAKQQMDT